MSSAMPTGGYRPNSPISSTLSCRRPNACGAGGRNIQWISTHTWHRTLQRRRRVGRPRRAHANPARATPASTRRGCYTQMRATANTPDDATTPDDARPPQTRRRATRELAQLDARLSLPREGPAARFIQGTASKAVEETKPEPRRPEAALEVESPPAGPAAALCPRPSSARTARR